jgi:hypothetical protein
MKKLDAYSIPGLSAEKLDRALRRHCASPVYLAMRGCVPHLAALVSDPADDGDRHRRVRRALAEHSSAGHVSAMLVEPGALDQIEHVMATKVDHLRRAVRRAGLHVGTPAASQWFG